MFTTGKGDGSSTPLANETSHVAPRNDPSIKVKSTAMVSSLWATRDACL